MSHTGWKVVILSSSVQEGFGTFSEQKKTMEKLQKWLDVRALMLDKQERKQQTKSKIEPSLH